MRADAARTGLLAHQRASFQHEPGTTRQKMMTSVGNTLQRGPSSCQGIGRFLLRL